MRHDDRPFCGVCGDQLNDDYEIMTGVCSTCHKIENLSNDTEIMEDAY